jgi:hypothetical protein
LVLQVETQGEPALDDAGHLFATITTPSIQEHGSWLEGVVALGSNRHERSRKMKWQEVAQTSWSRRRWVSEEGSRGNHKLVARFEQLPTLDGVELPRYGEDFFEILALNCWQFERHTGMLVESQVLLTEEGEQGLPNLPLDEEIVEAGFLALTCQACPSLWEGYTVDGRSLVVYYRSGRYRVVVGGALHYFARLGDREDGHVSVDEMRADLQGIVSFDQCAFRAVLR